MSIENGRWVPSIGDPTIIGWVTVAVYFIVALICLKAAFTSNSEKSIKNFWLFLTLVLISLGVNKQLDLQNLLTQLGKEIAIDQGWYKNRRVVQAGFIFFIGLTGITTLIFLIKTYRDTNFTVKIALTGCTVLFLFILIRAASFHHVDIFINLKFIEIKMNSFLELGGLAIIGVGGYRHITTKIPN